MSSEDSDLTASIGINNVWTAFNELGWRPVETHRHDIGTDLFVQVKDRERLGDAVLLLGVQVKAGPSRFSRCERENGEPVGWWYREEDKVHFDYWTSHVVPHLLVLCDNDTRTAFWVHVTDEVVKDTGAGAKILVPRTKIIGETHREALLRIAGSVRPAVPLEGTAWTGASPRKPGDELRFALLVPRLVAPHPNVFLERPLAPPQAIAMLLQARLAELDRYAREFIDVPPLQEATDSPVWAWRFYGALFQRVVHEQLEPLRRSLEDAPDRASRAAAAVAVGSALIEAARPHAALEVIDGVLQSEPSRPVDDAWLRVQRARALLDTGNVSEARQEAGAVQTVRVAAPDDVTATALQGIAAGVLFGTGAWFERKPDAAIEGADRAAHWWRTETLSRGASASAERMYKEWARDTSVTLAGTDDANDQLYVAALSAGLIGDHAAWQRLSGLLGRDLLVRVRRTSSTEECVEGLEMLRLAGDAKALELAVRRLREDGPAAAVRAAATAVDLTRSTRTTIKTDLALLRAGGDVLQAESAARATEWLGAALDEPDRLRALYPEAGSDPSITVLETLAGIAPAAPELSTALVVQHLDAACTTLRDDMVSAWGRLLLAIPEDGWSVEALESTWQAPVVRSSRLRWALLRLRAGHDDTARATLEEAAGGGSLAALTEIARIEPLSSIERRVVHAVVPGLIRAITTIQADAREGTAGMGPGDPARDLVLILADHPDDVTLDVLLDFLDDPLVARRFKGPAFAALARNIPAFPDELRQRWLEIAERAAAAEVPLDDPIFDPDIAGQAGYLAGVIDPASAAARVADLAAGTPRRRQWAAHLAASQDSSVATLLALVSDDHPRVRAAAAGAAAALLTIGPARALAEVVVRQAAKDPGCLAPLAIAGTSLPDVKDLLLAHVSATVRHRAS